MSEEKDYEEIRESVDEAKDPKTFSIVQAIANRSYPRATVSVSFDEATGYEAALVKEKIDQLSSATPSKSVALAQQKEIDGLSDKLQTLTQKMMESSYVFYIKGISEGKREELASEARKKYPIEYQKSSEISELLGGNSEQREKPSPERDNLFTDFLWRDQIEKIESPDGGVQDTFTYNDAKALRTGLPLSSLAKINSAIEKVRTATAVFMMETGEDFLAKP